MATPTQPNFIPEPWAETSGNFDTIPATQQETGRASWENGFPLENTIPVAEGGTPSHYLDFQGVLNALSSFAWWQQRGGQFTWSQGLEYPVGAFVLGSDGQLYKSIQASSPSDPQDPTTATAYWTIADPTAFLLLSGGTMTGQLVFALASAIARNVNNSGLQLYGGNEQSNGAGIWLYGKDYSSNPGQFRIRANDGSNSADLLGKPDGTLTLGGKDVECIDTIGTEYVRYKSGFQICWGTGTITTASTGKDVTYAAAFSGSNPWLVISANPTSAISDTVSFIASPRTTTGFIAYCNKNNAHTTGAFVYIAIGRWK